MSIVRGHRCPIHPGQAFVCKAESPWVVFCPKCEIERAESEARRKLLATEYAYAEGTHLDFIRFCCERRMIPTRTAWVLFDRARRVG